MRWNAAGLDGVDGAKTIMNGTARHTVDALMIGSAVLFRNGETSAIAKHPVEGSVAIGALGLSGDEQVERAHGGPHMAVHLYPMDHHAFWREAVGGSELLGDPGAFGSNLAVGGLAEGDVHIGDRFRLGKALLEISQPRKPCWKIEHRFGIAGMVATILQTRRCGWYFRVLEKGEASAGDMLIKENEGDRNWTVARAFAAIWGEPGSFDRTAIKQLAECEALTPDIRKKLATRFG